MGKIITNSEANSLGGTATSDSGKKCPTKKNLVDRGLTVSGNYDDKQCVQKVNVSAPAKYFFSIHFVNNTFTTLHVTMYAPRGTYWNGGTDNFDVPAYGTYDYNGSMSAGGVQFSWGVSSGGPINHYAASNKDLDVSDLGVVRIQLT